MTIATLLSGGEGVGVGARMTGIRHLWGFEIDDAVAGAARANGFDVTTADIRDVDPRTLERPGILHASPECQNASSAKYDPDAETFEGKETELDRDIARCIVRYVEVLEPRVVTLENVYGYRRFESFQIIMHALNRLGYFTHYAHLNAADFGGLILCPIHDINFQIALANGVASDYQHGIAPDIVEALAMMRPVDQARHLAVVAVAHLVRIIRLDIAAVATWQESDSAAYMANLIIRGKAGDALMDAVTSGFESMDDIDANTAWLLKQSLDAPLIQEKWSTISTETQQITILTILRCLLATANTQRTITHGAGKTNNCPLCYYAAVPQTRRRLILRAVRGGLVPWLPEPEPWRGWYGAIEDLVPSLPESKFARWQLARLPEFIGGNALVHGTDMRSLPTRRSSEPAFTVMANSAGNRNVPRAFILSNAATEWGDGVRLGDEPVHTVTEQSNRRTRAFIVDQNYGSPNTEAERQLSIRNAEEPMFTVTAGENRLNVRAWLSLGRVVKMTPRCLARFQSFPDDYVLPDADGLACRVIGNAVPPLMYAKLARVLKEAAA